MDTIVQSLFYAQHLKISNKFDIFVVRKKKKKRQIRFESKDMEIPSECWVLQPFDRLNNLNVFSKLKILLEFIEVCIVEKCNK